VVWLLLCKSDTLDPYLRINSIKAANKGNFKSFMNVLFLVLQSVPDATETRGSSTHISWASPLAAAIPAPVCLKDSTWQLDVFVCHFRGGSLL